MNPTRDELWAWYEQRGGELCEKDDTIAELEAKITQYAKEDDEAQVQLASVMKERDELRAEVDRLLNLMKTYIRGGFPNEYSDMERLVAEIEQRESE